MKAYKITEIKPFMSKLLIQNVFDEMLVSELMIQTFVKYEIDGTLNRDFYENEELEQLDGRGRAKWGELKPFAYQIVKGNKSPSAFHITLMLSQNGMARMCAGQNSDADVTAMYLHIKFEKKELYVITGIGRSSFSMDKSIDELWDEKVKLFLKKNKIEFE